MCFSFFKHKKKDSPKEYEGRFISEDEINTLTDKPVKSFIKNELDEINNMMKELRSYYDGGE